MELNDFAAAIQLAATLNIAFVAVEYAKSYTCIVAQKIFKFQEIINDSINRCSSHVDKETIESLHDVTVDGQSMISEIQEVQRDKEKMTEDIKILESELKNMVSEKCNSKSYSFISLYLFLFSSLALIIAGFGGNDNAHKYWIAVSFLSLFFIAISWILGEFPKKKLWFNYSSLQQCIIIFCILPLLSCTAPFITHTTFCEALNKMWEPAVIITVLLPYVNFIIFAIIIKCRSKHIHKTIEIKTNKIEEKCIELEKKTNKLSVVQEVSVKLKNKQQKITITNANNINKLSPSDNTPRQPRRRRK